MFKTLEDANRMAALARAMAADPAWGSDDARKLIEHASGRIEVTTGEVPSIPLQGVHWPDPALDDISDQIAAEYRCPLDEHRSLMREIELLTNTLPADVHRNGVPIGTTRSFKWRTFVREAVPAWSKRLREGITADELLVVAVAIDGDELLFRVCRHLDVHGDLVSLMTTLVEGQNVNGDVSEVRDALIAVLTKLKAYKAPKSRPPVDETIVAAAKIADDFWRRYRVNATVEFHREPTTEPKSEFARWFCAAMAAAGGLTNVQCRSLLDKHV